MEALVVSEGWWYSVSMELSDLIDRLHEKRFSLDTARLEGTQFSIDTWRRGQENVGTRLRLTVSNVSNYFVVDMAEVGIIDIHDVVVEADTVTVNGHMPVEITLFTSDPSFEIAEMVI
jgi:ribosomal protein L31E